MDEDGFVAIFLVFRIGKSLLTKDVLTRIKENEAIGLHNPIASMVIQKWVWNDKITCTT